jgi:hypothetical protein
MVMATSKKLAAAGAHALFQAFEARYACSNLFGLASGSRAT